MCGIVGYLSDREQPAAVLASMSAAGGRSRAGGGASASAATARATRDTAVSAEGMDECTSPPAADSSSVRYPLCAVPTKATGRATPGAMPV